MSVQPVQSVAHLTISSLIRAIKQPRLVSVWKPYSSEPLVALASAYKAEGLYKVDFTLFLDL